MNDKIDIRELPNVELVALLRILDASANRALEGIRVAEDVVRFGWDDRHLTEQLKQVRHTVAERLQQFDARDRWRCRETVSDVGTSIRTDQEATRVDLADIATANLRRAQEALRSMAESSKGLAPNSAEIAQSFESARYELYTIERMIGINTVSNESLNGSRLYVLVSGLADPAAFADYVRLLVESQVDVIQLRDKRLEDASLLERGRVLRELTAGSSTKMIINDRPDIASLARADGVHIGQTELSVRDARQIVGPGSLIGVSAHSIEQARKAVVDGADYLGVGPTFPSSTKCFTEFPGVDLLTAVAAEITLPAFAIGGISEENIDEVLAAGFTRIAVQGAIQKSDDPPAAIGRIIQKLT